MVPTGPPDLGRYQMPGTPATVALLLVDVERAHHRGQARTPQRSSSTSSMERNSSMGSAMSTP